MPSECAFVPTAVVLLAGTAVQAPTIPDVALQVKVGGILGTLCWTALAYWLKDDIGTALKDLARDDI